MKMSAIWALSSLCFMGCAHQSYSPRVDYIGEYRDAHEVNKSAAALTDADTREIKVSLNEFPAGVSLDDHTIHVTDDSPWELVAKATADSNGGRRYWIMQFYEYNEDEAWRKGFCYWQVPLHWLTLGMWTLVPTDYACNVSEGRSAEASNNRKRRVVRTLQKAAMATDADLVVLTGQRNSSLVSAETGVVLSTLEWDGGSGYLFRKKAAKPEEVDDEFPGMN